MSVIKIIKRFNSNEIAASIGYLIIASIFIYEGLYFSSFIASTGCLWVTQASKYRQMIK